MKKLNKDNGCGVLITFVEEFEATKDLGKRALYYIYDSSSNKKVGEILVFVSEDAKSLYIGDLDMCCYSTGKEFYNQGYGTKTINHFKKEFNNINGITTPSAVGFWKKCGAEISKQENGASSKFDINVKI